MTLNINLPQQLENMVHEKVAAGLYASDSEVVHEALRYMEYKDKIRAMKLDSLRQDIQAGLDSGGWEPLNIEAIVAEAKRRRDVKGGHNGARQ